MAKEEHYNIKNIKDTKSLYKCIIGERSNGKSYAAKKDCLKDAWENNRYFIYLRRYFEDVKVDKVLGYFKDMEMNDNGDREIYNITNGEADCITVFRNMCWFTRTNEDGTKERIKEAAYIMCIAQDEHYRSMAFVGVYYILFEEFIAPIGRPFLPRETEKFNHIISTVLRRRGGCVYMVANTNKVICPYFDVWGVEAKALKQGEITLVNYKTLDRDEKGNRIVVPIAIEYCSDFTGKKSMFAFGKSRKLINSGSWDTDEYPSIPKPYKMYRTWYKLYYMRGNYIFCIRILSTDQRVPFLYVHKLLPEVLPKTLENKRVVCDDLTLNVLHTQRLRIVKTQYDKLLLKLLDEGVVTYSDNMTATTFNELLKQNERRF